MKKARDEMNDDVAREVLGLDTDKWTLQFTDEQLRILQEIMRAEEKRRADLFGGLQDYIESFGP